MKNFFTQHKEDIQKIVRNYIFLIDKKKSDDDYTKMNFDKEYNFLEILDYKDVDDNIIVTYQISDKLSNTPIEPPVTATISKFNLLMVNMFKK